MALSVSKVDFQSKKLLYYHQSHASVKIAVFHDLSANRTYKRTMIVLVLNTIVEMFHCTIIYTLICTRIYTHISL